MENRDLSRLVNLRQELHKNPELSGVEFNTANRIREFIQETEPDLIIENLGGTGLAAVYKFPNPGICITIRCELDALPIQEVNDFNHRSNTDGVSHKCGHDGHMAIVTGLSLWLKEKRFTAGQVVLLFQPAEENGEGAKRVVKDERFRNLKTDYVFALHNIPKVPMHTIISMENGFSSEVESFIIEMHGRESHAAEPENGINPGLAISEVIATLAHLQKVDTNHKDFCIITPVHVHMGDKSYGISPADGELHYTLRTWNNEKMELVKSKIKKQVEKICQQHHLEHSISWLEYFPASINHAESNAIVEGAAKENGYNLIVNPNPFKFGEDFGWYAKEYKTAMFGLGAGEETPALHNPDYDFPDELIETGVRMFKSIISDILKG